MRKYDNNGLQICTKCNTPKTKKEFFFHSKHKMTSTYCRQCYSVDSLKRKRLAKSKCVEYKGGKCERCREIYPDRVFDFHHIIPSKKEFKISSVKAFNDRTKKELEKTQMLCANCHRIIHDEKL